MIRTSVPLRKGAQRTYLVMSELWLIEMPASELSTFSFSVWNPAVICTIWWRRFKLTVNPDGVCVKPVPVCLSRAPYASLQAFLVAQTIKSLPAMQETQVWSLDLEDPLESGMATHSGILAWRIPWTEEPGFPHPLHRFLSLTWWHQEASVLVSKGCHRPYSWALIPGASLIRIIPAGCSVYFYCQNGADELT